MNYWLLMHPQSNTLTVLKNGHKTKGRQECCSHRLLPKFVYPMYLAGFHHLRQHHKFLGIPSHFRGSGSANAVTLTSCKEHLIQWGVFSEHRPCVFSSSLSAPLYQLLHFAPVCRCFGYHHCDLTVREQANSKTGTLRTSSFLCLAA